MKRKIIGFCGKKFVGKDTLAKFCKELVEKNNVVEHFSFAYPLKNFIHTEFSIPNKNLWGSQFEKEYPLMVWSEVFTQECLDVFKKGPLTLLSARDILQVVGTNVMRENNLNYLLPKYRDKVVNFLKANFNTENGFNSIWIDLMFKDIDMKQFDLALITDVRFPNEVFFLKSIGGKVCKIYRDVPHNDCHSSEVDLDLVDDERFDYVIWPEENKTLNDLKICANRIMSSEGLVFTGGVIA